MSKQAWLLRISRGFGGDNAYYESRGEETGEINVAVSWAMGGFAMDGHYETSVYFNGKPIGFFNAHNGYARYVQPAEALSILGYEVHGLVDFAQAVDPVKGDIDG